MKSTTLLLLAGISLSVVLSSCDKEDVLPLTQPKPAPGTTPGSGGNTTPPGTTPTPGSGSTPPPTTTPPPTNQTPPPPTNQTPPPVTASSLLAQFGTKVLKYDAQGRLIDVSYSDLTHLGYAIVYEGDKPVRLNYKTGGWLIYTYEGDKVTEAVSYYGENLVNYRYRFEYNGDKLVKTTEMSYARYDEGRLGITTYSYDANGNLAELVVRWSTSNKAEDLGRPSVIKWGNYDSNPNPMPYAESTLYLPGIKLFNNNPGYRDPGSGKELYSYIYHDSGMPQQRYTKLEAYPHVQPFTDRYTYK
ncbi:hypothetical protein [Pontibacter ruber]|uniref:YD repeat-containing protein n=1 Tax=Pontibacter ruber TaxID=1343895 RepID=A0ABW5D1P0_9BACT|nr:hypothetical protein [Pontibacter ruber]